MSENTYNRYTKDNYHKYMTLVNKVILLTKHKIKQLEQHEKVSKLSYEEWVKFQKGELKLKDL